MKDWIPAIAAIGGGFVSGMFFVIYNWINKRSEEKRHLNQLILNTSIENWKQTCSVALEAAKINPNRKVAILPLEANIIYVMKLTDVLLNKKITKANVAQRLEEVREVSDEVTKFIKSKEENERKPL